MRDWLPYEVLHLVIVHLNFDLVGCDGVYSASLHIGKKYVLLVFTPSLKAHASPKF